LAAFGFPVLGDVLYGKIPHGKSSDYLAPRAIELAYLDPLRNKNEERSHPGSGKRFRKSIGIQSVIFESSEKENVHISSKQLSLTTEEGSDWIWSAA
jgi:hypothetical protein